MTEFAAEKGGWYQLISDAFRRFQKRQMRRAELEALGLTERERLAFDVGLSRTDLASLAALDSDSAVLMARRLADNGIEIKSIDPVMLRDMQRCCSQCESKERCEHELDDKPKVAAWPNYCPNEQSMRALMDMTCH